MSLTRVWQSRKIQRNQKVFRFILAIKKYKIIKVNNEKFN